MAVRIIQDVSVYNIHLTLRCKVKWVLQHGCGMRGSGRVGVSGGDQLVEHGASLVLLLGLAADGEGGGEDVADMV